MLVRGGGGGRGRSVCLDLGKSGGEHDVAGEEDPDEDRGEDVVF